MGASTVCGAENAAGGTVDTDPRPIKICPAGRAETITLTASETSPSTVTVSAVGPAGRFGGNSARISLLETASARAFSPPTVMVVFSTVPKLAPSTYPIDPGLTVGDGHRSLGTPTTVGACACAQTSNAAATQAKISFPPTVVCPGFKFSFNLIKSTRSESELCLGPRRTEARPPIIGAYVNSRTSDRRPCCGR